MASTNKTPHYNLDQYISTDKPTYLTDFNNDMSAIDSGMYNAQQRADSAYTLADGADTKADTAITNAGQAQTDASTALTRIGNLANLTTTEKTSVVGSINEVNEKANNNTLDITNLINLFSLTSGGTFDNSNCIFSGCSYNSGNFKLLKNSDNSIIKIYNTMVLNISSTSAKITIPAGLSGITEDFNVIGTGLIHSRKNDNTAVDPIPTTLIFKTNGNIEIELNYIDQSVPCRINLLACLIFVKNLGD